VVVSAANAQVAEFLKLFQKPTQKVFVHCYFGRTAPESWCAYRMAQQKLDTDQAIEECIRSVHYHWYPAMKSYVRNSLHLRRRPYICASATATSAPR